MFLLQLPNERGPLCDLLGDWAVLNVQHLLTWPCASSSRDISISPCPSYVQEAQPLVPWNVLKQKKKKKKKKTRTAILGQLNGEKLQILYKMREIQLCEVARSQSPREHCYSEQNILLRGVLKV